MSILHMLYIYSFTVITVMLIIFITSCLDSVVVTHKNKLTCSAYKG